MAPETHEPHIQLPLDFSGSNFGIATFLQQKRLQTNSSYGCGNGGLGLSQG